MECVQPQIACERRRNRPALLANKSQYVKVKNVFACAYAAAFGWVGRMAGLSGGGGCVVVEFRSGGYLR